MRKFMYWVYLFFASTPCLGQEKLNAKEEIINAIDHYFFNDMPVNNVADSAMFYTFFFKVEVSLQNGKQDASVTPGDSTAAKICPDYSILGKFDYSVFMKNRTKATFILPVIFEVIDSKGKRHIFTNNSTITDSMLALYVRNPPVSDIDNYIYFSPFTRLISKEVHD